MLRVASLTLVAVVPVTAPKAFQRVTNCEERLLLPLAYMLELVQQQAMREPGMRMHHYGAAQRHRGRGAAHPAQDAADCRNQPPRAQRDPRRERLGRQIGGPLHTRAEHAIEDPVEQTHGAILSHP